MSYTYANNVRAALGAAVGVGDVTLTIAAAVAPFNPPAAASVSVPARLTIVDNLYAPTKIEIITYTGRTGSGPYTLTGVTRAQESTTAQAFATGYVYQSATAADYTAFSALTDAAPVVVLGTGADTAFDTTDEMIVSHSTLSSASRFKRSGVVLEYSAGSALTDSTLDFDYADVANYTRETESPNATITPSATTNTYSNKAYGTGTTATFNIGRVTSADYRTVYQLFKGPAAATGFSVYLGANSATPAGDIGYKVLKVPYGNKYIYWDSCQTIASGQFTPTPSATNNVNFAATAYLDDSFYAIVFFVVSAQDGDGDYYNLGSQSATVANGFGATLASSTAANLTDGAVAIFTAENAQVVFTLNAGAINAGVTLTISGDYWYPSDIGKTVRGNSGHALITGLTDLCTGGTALSGAGTAASAFDNDLVGTSTSAGANGYVGYDFGSSKTVRGVSVMFADATYDRTLDLIIEVSDDNFTGSTTVVNPSARAYQNRCWYYWDITSPTAGRYIRIRETGGADLTVMEMECHDGTTALAHLNLAAFANTNAITSGNWTLEGDGWNNGWANLDGSGTGIIAPITTTTYATISSIASSLVYGGLHIVNRGGLTVDSHVQTAASSYGATIVHLGSNVFACAYAANSAADAYVVIATVASDGSVTFGAPVAFILGGSVDTTYIDMVALTSTTFIIAHGTKIWACTVSGTTITVGTATTNTANSDAARVSLSKVDSTRFVCLGSATYIASVCGSVSGVVITLGTKVDLNAAASGVYKAGCCPLDTDKVLGVYIQDATTTTIRGKVLSLTGTAISAGVEATATYSASVLSSKGVAQLGALKAIVCGNQNAAVRGQAIACTVSGTTITWGTAVNVGFMGSTTGVGGGYPRVAGMNASLAYMFAKSTVTPLTLSGTTITVGTRQPSIGGWADPSSFAIGTNHAAMFCNSYTSGNRGVIYAAKITAQSFYLVGPAMSVSFNGATYNVWNGSAARTIASSLNAIHGGTDGVWYYRDSASVWTEASSSTAIQALKQAQAYSANCMSIDEMKQMSAANWTTFGLVEGATTTYFAFTMQGDATRYLMPFDLDKFSIGYTSRDRWIQATGDYSINMGAEASVAITKNDTGSASIKAVILGPSS